jgi:hypothetical protein
MELHWYCTGVLDMRQQRCWGIFGFPRGLEWACCKSKETNSMTSDASELTPRQIGQQLSVLESQRYLNPANIERSQLHLQLICSVFIRIHCQFCYCSSVVRLSFKSVLSIRIALFDYSLFDSSVVQFIFCSDTRIVFQVFRHLLS